MWFKEMVSPSLVLLLFLPLFVEHLLRTIILHLILLVLLFLLLLLFLLFHILHILLNKGEAHNQTVGSTESKKVSVSFPFSSRILIQNVIMFSLLLLLNLLLPPCQI